MVTKTFSLEFALNQNTAADVGVVIVAAGTATRMAAQIKKLHPIWARPLIWHTILAFEQNPRVAKIVIVTRDDMVPDLQNIVIKGEFSKVTDIVCGADNRQGSVKCGADLLFKSSDIKTILVHDGARPLISNDVIDRVVAATEEFKATAPAVPVKDTIKKVGASGKVEQTLNRENLVNIQTPQGFSSDVLFTAFKKAGDDLSAFTDDASMVENSGVSVYTVMGDYKNIKVTTPEDLILAEAYLKG